jgi:hypothetical protein
LLLTFVCVKTSHRMALGTVVFAALATFAASQVVGETGGTRVFALVLGTLCLICTLMFGVVYVKLRKG